MTAVDNLAIALHVMLAELMPSEYFALGRFGREIEFVSNADAFPARALDYAGTLPPASLVNSVMPAPEYETIGLDPTIDRKNRRAFEAGLAWLHDGDTLLIGARSEGFDLGLVHVDGRRFWTIVGSEPSVEKLTQALIDLSRKLPRPE